MQDKKNTNEYFPFNFHRNSSIKIFVRITQSQGFCRGKKGEEETGMMFIFCYCYLSTRLQIDSFFFEALLTSSTIYIPTSSSKVFRESLCVFTKGMFVCSSLRRMRVYKKINFFYVNIFPFFSSLDSPSSPLASNCRWFCFVYLQPETFFYSFVFFSVDCSFSSLNRSRSFFCSL